MNLNPRVRVSKARAAAKGRGTTRGNECLKRVLQQWERGATGGNECLKRVLQQRGRGETGGDQVLYFI